MNFLVRYLDGDFWIKSNFLSEELLLDWFTYTNR